MKNTVAPQIELPIRDTEILPKEAKDPANYLPDADDLPEVIKDGNISDISYTLSQDDKIFALTKNSHILMIDKKENIIEKDITLDTTIVDTNSNITAIDSSIEAEIIFILYKNNIYNYNLKNNEFNIYKKINIEDNEKNKLELKDFIILNFNNINKENICTIYLLEETIILEDHLNHKYRINNEPIFDENNKNKFLYIKKNNNSIYLIANDKIVVFDAFCTIEEFENYLLNYMNINIHFLTDQNDRKKALELAYKTFEIKNNIISFPDHIYFHICEEVEYINIMISITDFNNAEKKYEDLKNKIDQLIEQNDDYYENIKILLKEINSSKIKISSNEYEKISTNLDNIKKELQKEYNTKQKYTKNQLIIKSEELDKYKNRIKKNINIYNTLKEINKEIVIVIEDINNNEKIYDKDKNELIKELNNYVFHIKNNYQESNIEIITAAWDEKKESLLKKINNLEKDYIDQKDNIIKYNKEIEKYFNYIKDILNNKLYNEKSNIKQKICNIEKIIYFDKNAIYTNDVKSVYGLYMSNLSILYKCLKNIYEFNDRYDELLTILDEHNEDMKYIYTRKNELIDNLEEILNDKKFFSKEMDKFHNINQYIIDLLEKEKEMMKFITNKTNKMIEFRNEYEEINELYKKINIKNELLSEKYDEILKNLKKAISRGNIDEINKIEKQIENENNRIKSKMTPICNMFIRVAIENYSDKNYQELYKNYIDEIQYISDKYEIHINDDELRSLYKVNTNEEMIYVILSMFNKNFILKKRELIKKYGEELVNEVLEHHIADRDIITKKHDDTIYIINKENILVHFDNILKKHSKISKEILDCAITQDEYNIISEVYKNNKKDTIIKDGYELKLHEEKKNKLVINNENDNNIYEQLMNWGSVNYLLMGCEKDELEHFYKNYKNKIPNLHYLENGTLIIKND